MNDTFFKKIAKNFAFIRENPQIVYTTFLLIIIPVAFLVTSQKFLSVATSIQEKLEKERIGLMQDVFAGFANVFVKDGRIDMLQERIESVAHLNETVTGFRVVVPEKEGYRIVASLDTREVGTLDFDERHIVSYSLADIESSRILPGYEEGIRHWSAVRGVGDNAHTSAIIYTDISMEYIDSAVEEKVRSAYLFLTGIIVVIGLLLVRQAKVIDYAVLYKRLKEVDQMKDDFVGMAAHELRTPLTIIRGYTEMLADSKRMTEADRDMTKKIEISANHLNQLVGDILDVSRMQQGRLSFDLKNIQPNNLIAEVVESLQYTASQKKLTLSCEMKSDSIISVDSDRLKQIMINLVGNAIKYTPKGSVIASSYDENGKYVIRVSDTGIGISAEEQKKLFTRFYRIRSKETEDIRGTGLGLWITKEIVAQMGGTITVESIKGKGTDIIVTFSVIKENTHKG